MQVNDINYSPAFGQVLFTKAAAYTIQDSLKPKEIKLLKEKLIQEKHNHITDTYINEELGFYRNKLIAYIKNRRTKEKIQTLSQKFFESKCKFIERCCDEAQNLKNQIKNSNK